MIKHHSGLLALTLAAFNLKVMRLIQAHDYQRLSAWYFATLFILPYFLVSDIPIFLENCNR